MNKTHIVIICRSLIFLFEPLKIKIKNGYIFAEATNGLTGAEIKFPSISVGATENAIIASVFARGETLIKNAAMEPEISDLAIALNKPFILLRKKNKLPAETHSVDFKLEYGEATIEVHKDSIAKGEKILVIDDLIATGGTAEAAAKLVEISKGKVSGFIFVINLFDLHGSARVSVP